MAIAQAEMLAPPPMHPLRPPVRKAARSIPAPVEERTDVTIDEMEALDPGYPFELINGKVVIKMAGVEQSEIVFNLSGKLFEHMKQHPIGKAFVQLNYRIIPGNKRQSRAPDISFIRKERLAQVKAGYPAIAPDLAVEIVSPNDRADDVFDKARLYLRQGVQEVWLIYPRSRSILVFTPTALFTADDTLKSAVLPDFALDVKALLPEAPPESELTPDEQKEE